MHFRRVSLQPAGVTRWCVARFCEWIFHRAPLLASYVTPSPTHHVLTPRPRRIRHFHAVLLVWICHAAPPRQLRRSAAKRNARDHLSAEHGGRSVARTAAVSAVRATRRGRSDVGGRERRLCARAGERHAVWS